MLYRTLDLDGPGQAEVRAYPDRLVHIRVHDPAEVRSLRVSEARLVQHLDLHGQEGMHNFDQHDLTQRGRMQMRLQCRRKVTSTPHCLVLDTW